ncbi:MAG: sugar ABC transporter substrate-binding protein [Alphaproteobacteria bacterium]|nr:MAG: sugar ABC transporter substrate-binding protein [Alphaproteobacteria bacterium]
MKRIIISLFVTMGLIWPALADEQGGYAILLKSSTSPYWMTMAQGFKDAAEQMGIPYQMHISDAKTTPDAQLQTCLSALEKKPEVLMVAAINETNLLPCLRAASEQKIQIVDIDNSLDHKEAEGKGVKLAFSIGSNNVAAGEQAADYLAQAIMPMESGDILIVQRPNGRAVDIQRIHGFRSKMGGLLPKMRLLQMTAPTDSPHGAANVLGHAIAKYPNIVAVFATEDRLALAASEAAKSHGKNIVTIGIGGEKEARNSVFESKLSATVAQLPYLIGKQSVEVAHDLQQGATPPPVIYAPTLLINDDVLNKKNNHLLRYVK